MTEEEIDPRDKRPTPMELAKLSCRVASIHINSPKRVLEPSCGEGNFLDAIKDTWPYVEYEGVELDTKLATEARARGHKVTVGDFFQFRGTYDLIIGNPPFSMASEFVTKSMRMLTGIGSLVYVLRLGFLCSRERFVFWNECKPFKVMPIAVRPSYDYYGGRDAREYMVCIWRKDITSKVEMIWLDNRNIVNRNHCLLARLGLRRELDGKVKESKKGKAKTTKVSKARRPKGTRKRTKSTRRRVG